MLNPQRRERREKGAMHQKKSAKKGGERKHLLGYLKRGKKRGAKRCLL